MSARHTVAMAQSQASMVPPASRRCTKYHYRDHLTVHSDVYTWQVLADAFRRIYLCSTLRLPANCQQTGPSFAQLYHFIQCRHPCCSDLLLPPPQPSVVAVAAPPPHRCCQRERGAAPSGAVIPCSMGPRQSTQAAKHPTVSLGGGS